jgi:hypothetical protein
MYFIVYTENPITQGQWIRGAQENGETIFYGNIFGTSQAENNWT